MKYLALGLAFLTTISPTLGRAQEPQQSKPTHANVKYGPHERNVLDFWQAKSDRPTPVVVFIHGGGFVGGDKSKANPKLIQRCLDSGVSYASINYRFRTEVPIQDVLRDCGRAIQFLRHQAKNWNIDKDRIAAHGGSAGAGTSLWLAFHDDLADPKSTDPILRESSRLKAAGAVGCQASYDIVRWKELFGEKVVETYSPKSEWPAFYGLKSVEEVLGATGQKIRADVDMLGLIRKGGSPVWLGASREGGAVQNRGHYLHHPDHAVAIKKRCDEVGVPAVLNRGRDAGTDGDLLDFLFKHLDVKARANPAAKPVGVPEKPATEQPAWIINGTDKLPKLKRLLGTTESVRVVVRDLHGKQIAEVRDVCNRHTDLNKLVGPGEYRLEFLDKEGRPIKLTQEVGEVLRLK